MEQVREKKVEELKGALLRPHQVEENKSEVRAMESMLEDPDKRKMIQDPGLLQRRLRAMKESLEQYTPKEFRESEIDTAIRREAELRDELTAGMPTQSEMRRCPPGAVEKNIAWRERNKHKIQEWKNLRLRLRPGDGDAANLERFRPDGGSSELNLDNSIVEAKNIHLPPAGAGPTVVITDEEKALLAGVDEELAGSLASLNNDQRGLVKGFTQELKAGLEEPEPEAPEVRLSYRYRGPKKWKHCVMRGDECVASGFDTKEAALEKLFELEKQNE